MQSCHIAECYVTDSIAIQGRTVAATAMVRAHNLSCMADTHELYRRRKNDVCELRYDGYAFDISVSKVPYAHQSNKPGYRSLTVIEQSNLEGEANPNG